MPSLPARSCLFASVALHAFHRQCVSYHHLFLVICVLANCSSALSVLLRQLATRAACLLVLNDLQRAIDARQLWLLWLPAAAALLWLAQGFSSLSNKARRPLLNALTHAAGAAAAHACLWALHPPNLN